MKKKYFFIVVLSCCVGPGSVSAMDDSEYENQIHNIYLKHYKDPVSNSDWNNTIQSLPQKYKLRFKDNLWDLSDSFLKNPLYWSKMWVINSQVENPHLIYKGNFIKFDPQSLAEVNTSEHSVDIRSQFPGLVVPDNPLAKQALSESEMPSSLPKLLSSRFFDNEIDISQIKTSDIQNRTIVPFYLTGSPPSTDGEVINKNNYGEVIGLGGEELVVRIDSTASIGSVFTVFENRGRIGSLLQFVTGLNEDEIVIKGRIRIVSYLQGTESLYVASVIEAMEQIIPEDSLLQGEPPSYHFSQKGAIGSGSGLIIGTPNKNQSLLSLGSIVYLNKGIANGIHKEQLFYIKGSVGQPKNLQRPHKYEQPLLGQLQIIHSAENRATGIITEANSPIYVGDVFTGSSDRIEDLSGSPYHEKVDEDETLEQGKELLIDVEEVEEDIEPVEDDPEYEDDEEDIDDDLDDEDMELEMEPVEDDPEYEDMELDMEPVEDDPEYEDDEEDIDDDLDDEEDIDDDLDDEDIEDLEDFEDLEDLEEIDEKSLEEIDDEDIEDLEDFEDLEEIDTEETEEMDEEELEDEDSDSEEVKMEEITVIEEIIEDEDKKLEKDFEKEENKDGTELKEFEDIDTL